MWSSALSRCRSSAASGRGTTTSPRSPTMRCGRICMGSRPRNHRTPTASVNREEASMVIATDLVIPAGHLRLRGRIDDLASDALVVFAHGSGSGMDSPRNRAVAEQIYQAGCATLLFDLLTTEE